MKQFIFALLSAMFSVCFLVSCGNKHKSLEETATEGSELEDSEEVPQDDKFLIKPGNAVDLGLPSGTKWADRNIGATSEEDFGDYFAWGETSPKSSYTSKNYRFLEVIPAEKDEDGFITKKEDTVYARVKDIAHTNYDAATANWGSEWQMPTKSQYEELRDYCKWTTVEKNGVKGHKVKGKNGNYIFLPYAGHYWSDGFEYCSYDIDYWTSTEENRDCAYVTHSASYGVMSKYRPSGLPVRPVLRK